MDYDQNHNRNDEIEQFSIIQKPDVLIYKAAKAENSMGKRYRHQCRIRKTAINSAIRILQKNSNRIINADNFHERIIAITNILSHVNGIGELYCYDTAFRIGISKRQYPEFIYVHTGVLRGVKELGLKNKIIANAEIRYIEKKELPKIMQKKKAYELENILCIYRDEFNSRKKLDKLKIFCNRRKISTC